MKNKWLFLLLLVGIVAYTIYSSGQEKKQSVDERPEIGFKAPHFKLESLDDSQIFSLENKQKPLILNFWASWCGPCRLEAPDLVDIYKKYGDQVDIYAINMTNTDDISNVKAFVEQENFNFPVLLDKDGSVSSSYNIIAVPTTFFVTSEGIIEHKITGYASKSDLESAVKRLVGD